MLKTARLFMDADDQCVELPKEFWFDREEVLITDGPLPGQITLKALSPEDAADSKEKAAQSDEGAERLPVQPPA